MSQAIDNLAPHNVEAEEAVLGSILLSPEALYLVLSIMDTDDFFIVRNAWIWGAIVSLQKRREPIDYLTVASELEQQGRLEEIGGEAYLLGLISKTPSALNIDGYASAVRQLAVRRRLIGAASRIAQFAHSDETDIQAIMARARHAVMDATSDTMYAAKAEQAEAAVDEAINDMLGERAVTLPTGIDAVDRLGLMQMGDVVYVAGRPSMGKSSLVYQWVANWTIRHEMPVLLVILESTRARVIKRMVAQMSGVAAKELSEKTMDGNWQRIDSTLAALKKAPLYIIAPGRVSMTDIYAEALRLRDSVGLGAVVIDTMNKVTDIRTASNRYSGMTDASNEFAALVGELGVLGVGVTQLNRSVESRGAPHIPMLSDLRDAGALEEDADIVWLIYRADYYVGKKVMSGYPDSCGPGEALVIASKVRDGSSDDAARLKWDAERVRFETRQPNE